MKEERHDLFTIEAHIYQQKNDNGDVVHQKFLADVTGSELGIWADSHIELIDNIIKKLQSMKSKVPSIK